MFFIQEEKMGIVAEFSSCHATFDSKLEHDEFRIFPSFLSNVGNLFTQT